MSSMQIPCLIRSEVLDEVPVQLGHEMIDSYLQFVWARARPNTLLTGAFDLRVFFTETGKI